MSSSLLLLGRVSSLGVAIILIVVVLLAALPLIIVLTGRRKQEPDAEPSGDQPADSTGQDEPKDTE